MKHPPFQTRALETGVLDGTTITLNGITMQVLRASVIQVFTHKDAA